MASSSLSVVLVAYHSESVLPHALASVRSHLPAAEVIVVDNGSSLTTDQLDSWSPGGRLIAGDGNVGFGGGVNRGVAASSSGHVLVLNPDAVLERVDVSALDRRLAAARFGLVAANEFAGGRQAPLTVPARSWRWTLHTGMFRWFLAPRGFPAWRVPWSRRGMRLSGAAFLVRKDEFNRLGGFDERIFLYHEDEEISARYRASGYPIAGTDAVVVTHEQGTSSDERSSRVLAWQLLGFLEMVWGQDGDREARRAARSILGWLTLVQWVGGRAARVPSIGEKALEKRASAHAVRLLLDSEAQSPPTPVAFENARSLFLRRPCR